MSHGNNNFYKMYWYQANVVASKNFKNLTLLSLPDPKLQNLHQNNSCKFTKPQKTKLHIYSMTTIGLFLRQCICNFHRSANIEDRKLK